MLVEFYPRNTARRWLSCVTRRARFSVRQFCSGCRLRGPWLALASLLVGLGTSFSVIASVQPLARSAQTWTAGETFALPKVTLEKTPRYAPAPVSMPDGQAIWKAALQPSLLLAMADGDINLSGEVNAADVLIAQQVLLNQRSLSPAEQEHGDVAPLLDGVPAPDGAFDSGDLLIILRLATGDLSLPVCGNGQVEVGEQCDDGNQVDGDGCSSSCQQEGNPSSFSISDAQSPEGALVSFTVSRSGDLQATHSVDYEVYIDSADSATSTDVNLVSGSLSFAANDSQQVVDVATTADDMYEDDEQFSIRLLNPSQGATISAATATGLILNDDAAPHFLVGNAAASEGDVIAVMVTRDADAEAMQSVDLTTVIDTNDSASSEDFVPTSGTLSFNQGEFSKTFDVPTTDDTLYEENESFTVLPSNPTAGAALANSSAQAIINNDETPPSFSIAGGSATEGNTISFTITRSGNAQDQQSISIATALGTGDTASADDFVAKSASRNFNQGQTSKNFTVTTNQDGDVEADETFRVVLSNPTNGASIAVPEASGTIINDDIGGGGGGNPVAEILAADLNGANGFRLNGVFSGGKAGSSVHNAGDVNGDGFSDVVVGASAVNASGPLSGQSYVVFGGTAGTINHELDLQSLTGVTQGFIINGGIPYFQSGQAVSGGDVNGDGLSDVLIGTPGDLLLTRGEGTVVFGRLDLDGDANDPSQDGDFGQINGLQHHQLDPNAATLPSSAGLRLQRPSQPVGMELGYLGGAIDAAGDINGDGVGDIIIGAPNADIDADSSSEGQAYIVFGQPPGMANNLVMDAGLDGTTGFNVDGSGHLAATGASVSAAGDVDGDGFGDFLVGAPNVNNGVGAAYLVFGSHSGFPDDLVLSSMSGSTGIVYPGVDSGGQLGHTVDSAGDLNGDGLADIVFTAPMANPRDEPEPSGRVYVVFGSTNRNDMNVTLSSLNGTNQGFMLEGGTVLGFFVFPPFFSGPMSVAGAGDFNGDGYDDLIVGMPNKVNTDNGQSYVVYGRSSGFQNIHGMDLSTDLDGYNGLTIVGAGVGYQAGSKVAGSGDVNGDGYADVIIASSAANGSTGVVDVVYGGDYSETVISSAQVFSGTAADDILVINNQAAAVAHLGAGDDTVTSAVDFQRLDGGTGVDTWIMSSAAAAQNLDLGLAASRISGFEEIDLNDSGNSLSLGVTTVLRLSDSSNFLRIRGGASNTLTLQETTSHGWVKDAAASSGPTDRYVANPLSAAPDMVVEVDDEVTVTIQ